MGKIGKITVEAMEREFGSKPEDILAAIGPSICQECYEVSEDVAEEFRKIYSQDLWKEILLDKGNEKYQLNLWEHVARTFWKREFCQNISFFRRYVPVATRSFCFLIELPMEKEVIWLHF